MRGWRQVSDVSSTPPDDLTSTLTTKDRRGQTLTWSEVLPTKWFSVCQWIVVCFKCVYDISYVYSHVCISIFRVLSSPSSSSRILTVTSPGSLTRLSYSSWRGNTTHQTLPSYIQFFRTPDPRQWLCPYTVTTRWGATLITLPSFSQGVFIFFYNHTYSTLSSPTTTLTQYSSPLGHVFGVST